MGKQYSPNLHWTSPLRSRANHKPYPITDPSISTFTVPDTAGQLKSFLIQQRYKEAKYLIEGSTFHIQVCVSKNRINSRFTFDSDQLEKVSCDFMSFY